MNGQSQQDPIAQLRERITFLLGNTLGAVPYGSGKPRSATVTGFRWGAAYAVLFCGLPLIVVKRIDALFWLSLWGSCYFACAATLAGSTSSAIAKVIKDKILFGLSEGAAIAVDDDLTRRFGSRRVSIVSLFAAVISAAASFEALRLDLKSPPALELSWTCCGLFILYVTAARTTFTARFYGTFAAHLKIDSDRIYPLDPANSLQVTRIAWVGQRVLLFWFGIVCLVATLVPLFSKDLPHFVKFVVPTASLFSIVFGTIVFLNSESDTGSFVKEHSESTLHSTEIEVTGLFNGRSSLDDRQWKRLNALIALHDKLVTTGSYRSVALRGLSLAVPLVGPVVVAAWPHVEKILKPLLSDLKFW